MKGFALSPANLSVVVVAFLLGLMCGVIAVSVFGFQDGSPVSSDATHSKVARGFKCQDVTSNRYLSLQHVKTEAITFMPSNVAQNAFPSDLKTTQSLWSFSTGSDIDVLMVVYGPGSDGQSYMVQFGKVTPSSIKIEGWSRTLEWAIGSQNTLVLKP